MARQYSRQEVLERLKKLLAKENRSLLPGAGTGISGKFAERGVLT